MKKVSTNRSKKINTIYKSTHAAVEEQNESETRRQRRNSRPGERITPLDFDNFIPWVCMQWSLSQLVTVVRTCQENGKTEPNVSEEDFQEQLKKKHVTNLIEYHQEEVDAINNVVIDAKYNVNDQLETVSIDRYRKDIPKKIIRAISMCLPFHPALNRLNIRKGGVSEDLICEISKLIPCSNITIICLDDSVVPQGNYHMLLKGTSKLTYLSLNRCKINDNACKEIAMNLVVGKPAANSLTILELASNNISDIGAQFLAIMLRTNRRLLHLNLSGNQITDDGANPLFKTLMEFELTDEEVMEMKRRRYKYLQNKQAAFDKYLEQELREEELREHELREQEFRNKDPLVRQRKKENKSPNTNKNSKKDKIVPISSRQSCPEVPSTTYMTPRERAQHMADKIVDECIDPYGAVNVECRDRRFYAKGNIILCSLNLAYNSLRNLSLKTLNNVLSYQHCMTKSPATGLIRIVLDGNYLKECVELNRIEFYMNFKVAQNVPVRTSDKLHKLSSSKKLRRTKTSLKSN